MRTDGVGPSTFYLSDRRSTAELSAQNNSTVFYHIFNQSSPRQNCQGSGGVDFPDRQSIRLKGYDYSQSGAYFVTICTHNRENMFGEIKNGKMVLNENGKIVTSVWNSLPKHHDVQLDCFQIMPNHIHAIIVLCRGFACKTRMAHKTRVMYGSGIARNAPTNKPTFQNVTAGSLPCIIRSFKSEITKQIRRLKNNPRMQIFQRNYYEHIIRNEPEYDKICFYILHNPEMWERDRNNLSRG